MPPSKAATTARPSTGANPNKSALHSVRIGLPPASETNRSCNTIFSVPGPRCTYPFEKSGLALHPGTHEGYVDWERSEAIRRIVSDNIPNSRHHGAAKHGDALLAGLIRCHRCGRKLTLRYTGAKHDIPRYSCSRGWLDNGEPRCIAFGGL